VGSWDTYYFFNQPTPENSVVSKGVEVYTPPGKKKKIGYANV